MVTAKSTEQDNDFLSAWDIALLPGICDCPVSSPLIAFWMPALLHGWLSPWIPASLAFCFCCQLLLSTRKQHKQAWPSCVSAPCPGWIGHKGCGFCCSGSLPGFNCRAHVILKHGTVRRAVHCLRLLAPHVCNGKILQLCEIVRHPKLE